ncbi:hypothetical protein B1T48_02825 [Mycobacterium persicum]|nr:hypothetical protein B1T48_02825 [Mycobacterium persicum]
MSFVNAAPETISAAAADLASISTTIGAANATVAVYTTRLAAAGADEVSAALATLFGSHGRLYQAVSLRAAEFHEQFTQALAAASISYSTAETTSTALVHDALSVLNAPSQALLGRPLIGNGTNGGPGQKAVLEAIPFRRRSRHGRFAERATQQTLYERNQNDNSSRFRVHRTAAAGDQQTRRRAGACRAVRRGDRGRVTRHVRPDAPRR